MKVRVLEPVESVNLNVDTLEALQTSTKNALFENTDGTGLNLSGSSGTNPLTSGSIGIFISAASSSAFTFNEARYDLEMVSGSGATQYVTRLIQGKVKLSKEVTV